jgi:hypothetical protein
MKNAQVKKIINLPRLFMNSIVIRWQVTSLCNYQCDFCIQGSRETHLQAAKEESLAKRQEITDNLVRYIETKVPARTAVELYLIGGEVTILKDFRDIVARFVNCGFKGHIIIYLTTNLSRDSSYYSSLSELFKDKRNRTFNLHASYYVNYISPEAFRHKVTDLSPYLSKERWQNRLLTIKLGAMFRSQGLFVKRENVFMTIGVPILNDDSWHLLEDFRSFYHKSAVHANPIIIRDYETSISDNVLARLKSSGGSSKKLVVSFLNGGRKRYKNIQQLGIDLDDTDGRFYPAGYICDAGQRCFSVSSNGSVWRCPVLSDSSLASKGHLLGDINGIDSELLSSPAVCGAGHCSCNYFTIIRHA